MTKKFAYSLMTAAALVLVSAPFVNSQTSEKLPDGPKYKWPGKPPIPKDNPMSAAKIELGKKLYFDARLSKSNKISCNSCHNVMKAGDDGLPRSPGHDGTLGGRNSPTVFNSAYWSVQFWDGRAPSLEEQAKGPLVNPIEMGTVETTSWSTSSRPCPPT